MPGPQIGGQVATLEVAGRTIIGLTNLIVLHSYMAAQVFTTARLGNGTAGYVVPAQKQLRIVAVLTQVVTANAGSRYYCGYGDTDVGINSVAAPTNNVSVAGASTTGIVREGNAVGNTSVAIDFIVPAGKYVYAASTNAGQTAGMMFYGILEDI